MIANTEGGKRFYPMVHSAYTRLVVLLKLPKFCIYPGWCILVGLVLYLGRSDSKGCRMCNIALTPGKFKCAYDTDFKKKISWRHKVVEI